MFPSVNLGNNFRNKKHHVIYVCLNIIPLKRTGSLQRIAKDWAVFITEQWYIKIVKVSEVHQWLYLADPSPTNETQDSGDPPFIVRPIVSCSATFVL